MNSLSQTYDANGNMIERNVTGTVWTQTFDGENRLTVVSGQGSVFSYQYDGDGNRVKQVHPDGTFTIYIAGLYEVTYSGTGALLDTKVYYAFAGKVVAMRDNSTLYYLHTDHLGSTRVVTGGTGRAVSLNAYYPFGASKYASGARPTDMDFTGQRLDATGLNFYNARYYDSAIGRFISADTVVPDPGGSQGFNRYAYSLSNPLNYTDPSRHLPEEDDPPPPITFDDENGLCIDEWTIGCSGTVESNLEWIEWNFSMLPYEIIDRRLANPEYLNEVSLFFTDAAFTTSSAGALVETTATILGLAGSPFGGIVGAIAGNQFHLAVTNPIETSLSYAATGTTLVADYEAGNTGLSAQNGTVSATIGEASATALTLQTAGTFMPIGVIDAGIDGYASAYSQGNAPGIFGMFGLNGRHFSLGPLSITLGR